MHISMFFSMERSEPGGHAKAILEAHPEIKRYIGCDKDPEALEIAERIWRHGQIRSSWSKETLAGSINYLKELKDLDL